MNELAAGPVIVADTREQEPFAFRGITGTRGRSLEIPVVRRCLKTGDYSVEGLEDAVAIERKSKADLFRTIGRDRARFERELERLTVMAAPALVIECDLQSLLERPPHCCMAPSSVLNSLLAWSIRHRVPVWACPGRRFAEIVTYRLLRHYWNVFQRAAKEGERR
jgi:ERCC4-type nuclease